MSETPKDGARRLAGFMLAKGYQLDALHEYTDRDGNPLYYRIRAKHPITGDKWIRPIKKVGDSFILGEPELPDGKPLYRLHQLYQRPNEVVYLVEGEKCVDALELLGLLATTSGGADSFSKADWGPLAHRTVRISADNDFVGARYAEGATIKLQALGSHIHDIDPDSLKLPQKGDLVDWLNAFRERTCRSPTKEDIESLPLVNPRETPFDPKEETPLSQPTNHTATSLEEIISHLAGLSVLEYDRVRREKADKLGMRVSSLDILVKKARASVTETINLSFVQIEPWPEEVNGAELLDELVAAIERFIVCDSNTRVAVALWCVMTWLIDYVQVAPLAVITAPEKRCGKSQLLNLIGKLSRCPLVASNISPAATFRTIEAYGPTLLIDEADSFLKDNEELRGVINSGHTRQSAYVIRTVGDDHAPKQFSTWGAKAISGIGRLSETLMDRAIILALRRKLPSERVERLRHAEPGYFDELVSKLARYAADAAPEIEKARPGLPEALNDRAQDNWEPLLAIADHAGGEWPQRARSVALQLSGSDEESKSLSSELLADIRDIFKRQKTDKLSTVALLKTLNQNELRPWQTYNRGREMTSRHVSDLLKPYAIHSKDVRVPNVLKGYELSQFEDAFIRYLPSLVDKSPTSATTLQSNVEARFDVADETLRCGIGRNAATAQATPVKGSSVVADKNAHLDGANASTSSSPEKLLILRI